MIMQTPTSFCHSMWKYTLLLLILSMLMLLDVFAIISRWNKSQFSRKLPSEWTFILLSRIQVISFCHNVEFTKENNNNNNNKSVYFDFHIIWCHHLSTCFVWRNRSCLICYLAGLFAILIFRLFWWSEAYKMIKILLYCIVNYDTTVLIIIIRGYVGIVHDSSMRTKLTSI